MTVINAFISSSADCSRERGSLDQAIKEFNRGSVSRYDLEVRPFGPGDLYPAHGVYAQAGLSRQLEDHELHIGVWREAAGTATPTAPSGTVEELRQALARHAKTRRPWIMCYFWRSSPTDFSQVKDEVEKHGWYYHGFDDPQHLGTLFYSHLSGYIRDEYRLPGHSTTRLDPRPDGAEQSVLLTFQIFSPGQRERKLNFERPLVTIGRQRERSDIVLSDARVHREQGAFVWRDGLVFYMDFGGDSQFEPGLPEGDTLRYGLQSVRIGDAVIMPDDTRIVLRAVVD